MMQVAEVSNDDGKACAQLINFLKAGRWDLTGNDAEELVKVKRWVHGLATAMADNLKGSATAAPSASAPPPVPSAPSETTVSSFRIKAMGPIGSGKPSRKKKR